MKILSISTSSNIASVSISENYECILELNINGSDLIELGYIGKEIKSKLNECLELVLHDPRLNKKEYLMNYLKNNT